MCDNKTKQNTRENVFKDSLSLQNVGILIHKWVLLPYQQWHRKFLSH